MPSSTAPKPKRRNLGITSIFPSSSPYSVTPASELAPPLLPTHIQSSLFTVGMRIRKAVAQGYKTESTSLSPYLPARVRGDSATLNSMSESASDYDQLSSCNRQLMNRKFILEDGARARDMLKRSLDGYEKDVQSDGHLENQGQQPNVHQQELWSAFDTLMSNRHLAIPKSQKRRYPLRREHHAPVVDMKLEAASEGFVEDIQDDFDDAVFLRPVDEVKDGA